jgi:hypothetical protein
MTSVRQIASNRRGAPQKHRSKDGDAKNNSTFRGEIESLARALLVRNRASITDSLLTAAAAGSSSRATV